MKLFRILCLLFAVSLLPSLAEAGGFVQFDWYGNPVYMGYSHAGRAVVSDSQGNLQYFMSRSRAPAYYAPGPSGGVYHREHSRTYGDGRIRTSIRHRSW